MTDSLNGAIVLVSLLTSSAAAQAPFEDAEKFHQEGLRPAIHAVVKNDLPEARRLARVLLAEFEKLPPVLQMGQVADLQRLSRLYMEKGLAPEADVR